MSEEVRERLRRYAEETLRDLAGGFPEARWRRLEGNITWEEEIDGDLILFHVQILEFEESYLHLLVEACRVNFPHRMNQLLQWREGDPPPTDSLICVSIDDIVPRKNSS